MKKSLILILVLSLSVVLMTGCGKSRNKTNSDNNIDNNVNNIPNEDTIDGIKLTNVSFTINNGIAHIVTEITNTTDEVYQLNSFSIIVKDYDDNVIATVPAGNGEFIESGSSVSVESIISDVDLSAATSIEYELKK